MNTMSFLGLAMWVVGIGGIVVALIQLVSLFRTWQDRRPKPIHLGGTPASAPKA